MDLFITSTTNTSGTVTIPQQGWSVNFDVIANQTTTVNVPNNLGESITAQIIDNKGIYVETQDTVAVFAINMEQYTADGSKILPTQSLGTEYRIATYFGIGTPGSEFMIVATEDDTEIIIIPTVATTNGDAAGVPFTINLDAGQSYMVQTSISGGDFTGTSIIGTEESGPCRPFAVFSGSYCSNIPSSCGACDHIYEQNFPVPTWGSEYFVIPFNTLDSYTYRVVADQDGTDVTIDGALAGTLAAGAFLEFNNEDEPHCVVGSNPIACVQYLEGIDCAGDGDPAMLVLNAASQKIDNITFSTVESDIITTHNITVITASDQIDAVSLDGSLIDPAEFTAIPSCPDHSYARMSITEGSHTLIAEDGFTCYVYGNGFAESYAYSAGSFQSVDPLELLVDSVVCSSDSVILQSDQTFFNIEWYAQSDPETIIGTGPTLILTPPIISDVYIAFGNLLISGCESEQWFLVEAPNPPLLVVDDEQLQICQYQSVQLGVETDPPSGIYDYSWTPLAGLDNPNAQYPVATPLETTVYTVLVSTPSGCGSAVADVTVEVLAGNIGGVDAFTDDDEICSGDQVQLSADVQEVTYEDNFDPGVSWGLWCDITNGTQSSNCGSVSGNALYFNGAGSRYATTEVIDASAGGEIHFAIKIANGVAPCDDAEFGENVVLEYSTTGCAGPFTAIQTLFEASYPDFTSITTIIPAGAQTAATHFRWRQLMNSGVGQDNWALDDVYITISNPAAYSFEWTPDQDLTDNEISDPLATPGNTLWYYVELTDVNSGCSYVDSVFIDVGQAFTLDITNDTTLCDVQGIEISAIPDGSDAYSWVWGPDDGSIAGIFSSSPTVTPDVTTTYTVNVSNNQGCEQEGEVEITVNQLLDLTATTDNDLFCEGEVANLSALVAGDPAGLEFDWSPDNFLDDPTSQFPISSASSSIIYTVTVTDTNSGCTLSEDVELEVYEAFTIDVSEDESLCTVVGFALEASASTAEPLIWSWEPAANVDNAAIPSPTVVLDATQQLTVVATNPAGCSQTDTVNLVLLFESFDLGPDVDICEGFSATLLTGYDDSFDHDWSTNETTAEIVVDQAGLYSVTVSSPLGCEHTDDVTVILHTTPIVDLGPDQSLCEGQSTSLNAANPGADYLWSTNAQSQSISVSTDGNYSVEVEDQWGCIGNDAVFVVFNQNPEALLPDSETICEDEVVTLDAGNPGSNYEWSTDQTSQTINVNVTGIYSVDITNIFGCTTTDQTELIVATYPVVDLGSDKAFCQGEFYTLDSESAGLNILWSTGEQTETITVSQSAYYTVTVDNGYCFTTDGASIVFNPLPIDALGNDSILCFITGGPQTLDAGNYGSLYLWNTGETTQQIEAESQGTYTVEVTTPLGCSLDFDIYFEEICEGILFIPNTFTPDNDGLNDAWFAYGTNVIDFDLQIWNRWGELIFESNDITKPWDGSVTNGDYYVESETYVYTVIYTYLREMDRKESDPVLLKGHITVIR